MSSLRLTHLGPSLCTRRCVWSSARPLSLPRAAEMPPKKTGRGANLSLLNKEHPKDKKGDDDIGDLEYVDKPDDSSSSGESTGCEALVQSTLPFSGASSAPKKGKKKKRPRTAEGRSQLTLADFIMPRLASLSAGATSQPPADAPADAPTSSPAAPTEEMAPALPEPEQLPPPELAAEPPAKPKRGRPPGSKKPAQAGASNPGTWTASRPEEEEDASLSEVWCSQERYANAWSAGAGGAGPRRALRLRRASLATREGLEGDFWVDFWEVVPIERSRRALFGGVLASFFFAREAFLVVGNVN